MLRNNLSVLLAERQLRISKVSNDTGISRTTLTSLTTNNSKMVQLETINKLCQSLNVSVAQFFEYVPFDFDYTFDQGEIDSSSDYKHGEPLCFNSSLFINVSENNNHIDTIELQGYTEHYGYNNDTLLVGVGLRLSDNEQLKRLQLFLERLSVAFIEDIKKDIESVIVDTLKNSYIDGVDADILIDFNETVKQFQTKLKNSKDTDTK